MVDSRHTWRGCFYLWVLAIVGGLSGPVAADDAATTTTPLVVPVFESVDENSVDLANGTLRVRSPSLTVGTGEEKVAVGLEWTGQAWRYIGVPMINRDDGTYYVTYNDVTHEFNGQSSGFSEKKPLDGSTLNCLIWDSHNMASECTFIDRSGDVVVFYGRNNPFATYPSNYGMQTLAMGNLGMTYAQVTSGANPFRTFGENLLGGGFDNSYYGLNHWVTIGGQQLVITTPNQDGTDTSKHYLRPKNTTQQITDDFGSIWSYTVNDNADITTIQPPDGLAATTYTYDSSHRVTTVVSPAGTWTYSYSSSDPYVTTTVVTPAGRTYSVTARKDYGYVTQYTEGVGQASPRVTTYEYDSGHRLTQITYPEQNKLQFTYDARGNVLTKMAIPKPSSTEPTLTWSAGYDSSCTERVLCNRPHYIIDPLQGRTDFTYAPHGTTTVAVPIGGATSEIQTFDYGHGKPIKVEYPPASAGAPRKTVTYTYTAGRLSQTNECKTTASCAGTSDEIVTAHDLAALDYSAELVPRGSTSQINSLLGGKMWLPISQAVTADGATHRTCFDYDTNGRLVAETPPNANLSSCDSLPSAGPPYNATQPSASYAKTAPTFSQ